ncbi:MAG: hypothetical protein QNJ70_27460 [Xenococcaceae cyanobacterium MO_207.B15]|nr:hypothetical protein [Xenococcaceae cyanobacterium MO_207.B15]MDJ0746655.1 hypothetical protein [Xenococcaceae cyanobacterium MO_167.B27]
MNNRKTTITLGLMVVLSLIGGFIAVDLVKAQTNRVNYQSSDIPIDDQARYLRGLETRDSSQWNFTTTENRLADSTYQLSISKPDIRIIEQDIPEWRNTGEDADYSVLVDIYDFREE